METAIRDSDFVLIVCTPQYRDKSNRRLGGVGYEGHIIAAELMTDRNERKFVPLLRSGDWREAAPSSLLGKSYIDLRGNPYPEESYHQLLRALRKVLNQAPPLGTTPLTPGNPSIDMVGVTNLKVYADFRNAALRVHQASKNRIIIIKQGGFAAQLKLPRVEEDLQLQGRRVSELNQEIYLFASEPVRTAAANIAGLTLAIEMSSVVPEREPQLDEAFQKLINEWLPMFDREVRREIDARGGAV